RPAQPVLASAPPCWVVSSGGAASPLRARSAAARERRRSRREPARASAAAARRRFLAAALADFASAVSAGTEVSWVIGALPPPPCLGDAGGGCSCRLPARLRRRHLAEDLRHDGLRSGARELRLGVEHETVQPHGLDERLHVIGD